MATANGNAVLRRSNGVLRGGKSLRRRRRPDDGVGTYIICTLHTHNDGTLVSVEPRVLWIGTAAYSLAQNIVVVQ